MELPPPPAGIDLSQNLGPTILAASLTTWLLALIAIALRLVGRRMKGVTLWLDDWLIIAAVVSPYFLHSMNLKGKQISRTDLAGMIH